MFRAPQPGWGAVILFLICFPYPLIIFVIYVYHFLYFASDIDVLDNPSFVIVTPIVMGTILFFSVIGWIAVLQSENKRDARMFGVFQACGAILEIVILFWFMHRKFEFEHAKVEKWMIESRSGTQENYQIRHGCCGVNNYKHWSENGELNIPHSCCKPEFPDCARNRSRDSICCGLEFPYCNSDNITDQVYEVGCQPYVEAGIQDYKRIVTYAGLIVILMQLLPIVLVLNSSIRSSNTKQEENTGDNKIKSTDKLTTKFVICQYYIGSILPLLFFPVGLAVMCAIIYSKLFEKGKIDEDQRRTRLLVRCCCKVPLVLFLMLYLFGVFVDNLIGYTILVDEMTFIIYVVAIIFSFVVYTTVCVDFYECFLPGKSLVKIGMQLSQHTVAIALQIALLVLYVNRGTYFEDRVEGWLGNSMRNYNLNRAKLSQEGMVTSWDSFQSYFECCGINNYTDWCGVTGLIPASCCEPEFPNCGVLGNDTDHVFDEGCKRKVLLIIEGNLTSSLHLGVALVVFQFFCFLLEMKWKRDPNFSEKPQNQIENIIHSGEKYKHIAKSIQKNIRAETNRERKKNSRDCCVVK